LKNVGELVFENFQPKEKLIWINFKSLFEYTVVNVWKVGIGDVMGQTNKKN